MRLGIVYHTRFWQMPDGSIWEAEGSLARYVDSLAPYFDEIALCVPVCRPRGREGSPVRARNVRLAPLPDFEGPRQFYPRLPGVLRALAGVVREWDILHCRVPTPAAFPAFILARRRALPMFLLVVGDLRSLISFLPYRGAASLFYRAYIAFEEWGLRRMIRHSVTFTNGAALYAKHRSHGAAIVETRTTTINAKDIADRSDTCQGPTIRLLCVSRIHSRKGLRCLPAVLERLLKDGRDVRLDVIGPTGGRTSEEERAAIIAEAHRLGVTERLTFLGPMPLDILLPFYRHYDLFVLPTLAGEGIPRVLLEAMAAGLPVVTTGVDGIPSLVTHRVNGVLVPEPSAAPIAGAVSLLIDDPALRQRLIKNGYATAQAHTLETQARWMMDRLAAHTGLVLRGLA